MASEKYSELIQAIDSEPLKEILLLLTKDLLSKTETIKKQNAQIRELRNEVTDLKERISEQEKYSSKDTIIINNLRLLQDADLVSSVLYFQDVSGYSATAGRPESVPLFGKVLRYQ